MLTRLTLAAAATLTAVAAAGGAELLAQGHSDGPDAGAARLATPRPLSPANGARADALPAFSWRAVRRAKEYEFQLAADRAFESIVDRGAVNTKNTYATLDEALADGRYWWRVRAVDGRERAGRWSLPRELRKEWTARPQPVSPADGAAISYPGNPLVLRWEPVRHAYKYLVRVATDPALANSALPRQEEVETSATVFAPQVALPPGRYYWAVTPLDAQKHRGARSRVMAFDWTWPTATPSRVDDLNADARVFDPQLSWDAIPGAAQYEVEVNPSDDFAPGSKVCCDGLSTGTSVSPQKVLANNRYYWRVRAVDVDGNTGVWNNGPSFVKNFDAVAPTVPNLHLRDHENQPVAGAVPAVQTPLVVWDPVPGASSYQVQVAPHENGACNWTPDSPSPPKVDVVTATTAWTPLSPASNGQRPGGVSFPRVSRDTAALVDGVTYCTRVLARTDRDKNGNEVVSGWTQLGGAGQPAFTFDKATPAAAPPGDLVMPAGNYRVPQAGTVTPRMPYFTWAPVAGAQSYFVVVARDSSFTHIVDLALTQVPAYAPRDRAQPHTYPDETTTYYWAVVPAKQPDGGESNTQPGENSPQPFEKRSVPPALISPGDGSAVAVQPTFRWSSTEGARYYRLQVAQDPSFGELIDDVTTASTAYTSLTSYAADTILYWRVRAADEDGIGLTWSRTGVFRRSLPVPGPMAGNPSGGETIPALAWNAVQGAVSYDVHVEQADGTVRDFTLRSPVFTPVVWYGTGVWHYQVRANFRSGARTVSGGYFPRAAFTRRIGTPAGARGRRSNGGVLVSWEPSPMAKEYRVEVATSNSFRQIVDRANTDNVSFAPRLTRGRVTANSQLYWRVAVVDEGGNVGGYASGWVTTGRSLRVRASGRLRRGRRGVVRVRVTDSRRRPVSKAQVRVSGAAKAKTRRTNRRGVVVFRLTPRKKGRVTFRAVKRRYDPGRAVMRAR